MQLIKDLKDKLQKDPHFLELLKGSGTAFVLRIIGLFFSYIFLMLISRYFGSAGVGIFALSLVFLNIGGTFAKGGLHISFLRFVSEYVSLKDVSTLRSIYKKVLSLAGVFSLTFSILLYFLSPFLADLLGKPYLSSYFKIMSIGVVPLVYLSINTEGLRGLKRIKEYILFSSCLLNLFAIFIFFTCVFCFNFGFKLELKVFTPEISYISAVIIMLVVAFFSFQKLLKKAENTGVSTKSLSYSEILNVSLPMLVSGSLIILVTWTDTIMLGWLGSVSDVGIYNVAIKIARIVIVFLTSVNTIAAPKFAEFYANKDYKAIARVAKQASKLVFFLTFPFVIIILIFPDRILLLFGKDFVNGKVALIILISGFLFNAMAGSVGNILQMTGNQRYHRNVLIIGTFLNIFLNYFLIPVYGLNGAAIASAVSMIFWNFMFSIKVKKLTGEWVFFPQIKNGE